MTKKHAIRIVRDYHERTKHRPGRYAASPGYMDWANQPNPFRRFSGAQPIALPHPDLQATPAYDGLFSGNIDAAGLDANFIGRLFFNSLALSAWKQAPRTRPWSLRINPSSGALYPTEGYLISGPIPGVTDLPGVFHYAPLQHQLERRCSLSLQQWERLTRGFSFPCFFVGLASIYWRESWKYGERAFRYCQHDVGHAIGAMAFSARASGWQAQVLEAVASDDVNRLLGVHLQTGIEAEHADALLLMSPNRAESAALSVRGISCEQWHKRIPHAEFAGEPDRLSQGHHEWPVIEEVSRATRVPGNKEIMTEKHSSAMHPLPPDLMQPRKYPAEQIIRQRRSAVDMDGKTWLDRTVFYQMLQRTMPAQFAFHPLPWQPQVSLAVFVHRVRDLPPGLYLLVRDPDHEKSLRRSLKSDFRWQPAEGCPDTMRFYRLIEEDMRRIAKMVSCYQDIAGDSAFSLGMLASFDAALAGEKPWAYPRLFWECGLIGQVLYLEAEAAGIGGTGIGCFFDDAMHEVLGIDHHSWQSLYHFTVGGPVTDARIRTIPPYAHLPERA